MARSIAERVAAEYDRELAELDRAADGMLAEADVDGRAFSLPGAAVPTKVHGQVLELMEHILELGAMANAGNTNKAHPVLGATLRVLRKVAPEAAESLAQVPEDELKVFLGHLARDIERSVEVQHTCPSCGTTFADYGPRPSLSAGA